MTLYKYGKKKKNTPTPLLCSIALVHSPTSTYTEIKHVSSGKQKSIEVLLH